MKKILLSLISFATFIGTYAQVNKPDSLALVDLYNSTNGANWSGTTNWLSNKPLSTWGGVTVTGVRVTKLALNGKGLKGSLPISLGNLTGLTSLSLASNQLNGSIPSSIGNLTNLTYLSFSTNQLTDSIPYSIGNLTKLTFLALGYNLFTGPIPASMGNFVNLTYMNLCFNQLSGSVPASLGNLKSISTMFLEGNQLSGLVPTTLSNLTNLRSFTLFTNKFNFGDLESIIKLGGPFSSNYSPQDSVDSYNINNKLYVSVGGTPSNNTYTWYDQKDSLVATKVGDSTYTAKKNGVYYVTITNTVANQLILTSKKLVFNGIIITPITLDYFKAEPSSQNDVSLQWKTAIEINTNEFVVERSLDGKIFEQIGSVKAIGTGANTYGYIDNNPTNGSNYYRLKSVDNDGKSSFSNVILVNLGSIVHFTISPNPARDFANIGLKNTVGNIGIMVYDVSGKVVLDQSVSGGTNFYKLNTQHLNKGIYVVKVKIGNESYNEKLLID